MILLNVARSGLQLSNVSRTDLLKGLFFAKRTDNKKAAYQLVFLGLSKEETRAKIRRLHKQKTPGRQTYRGLSDEFDQVKLPSRILLLSLS